MNLAFVQSFLPLSSTIGLTLSPLTVIFAAGIVPLVMLGRRGLETDERRWFTTILVAGNCAARGGGRWFCFLQPITRG